MKDWRNNGLLLVANWRSDVGYAWRFMERIWVTLAESQAVAGGQSHLIYPEVGVVPDRIKEAPIEIHEIDFGNRTRGSKRLLKRLIHDEGIRSVYLTDRAHLAPFYGLLRLWGVRSIVNNDQMPGDRTTSRVKGLLKGFAHRLHAFTPDLNIAPSEFVARRFREIYGLPDSRTVVIPNGIEPIDTEHSDPNYAHRKFKIPEDATIVVSLSRATDYKGIPLIIACADRLIRHGRRDDLFFVHCGDGPDLEGYRNQVKQLGIETNFFLPGAQQDYRDILPSCDIGIHASKGEGFSLAILEMMSAGLPILVPANSGNKEAVEHGRSGLCYRPGDIDAMSENLEMLLANRDVRRRIGTAARSAVLERFTLERTLRLYREIVAPLLTGDPQVRS